MSHSTDPELSAALDSDAAKLEAMGQDAGPEVEDFDFDDGPDIGCPSCDNGWRHGCCDDLCRSARDGDECREGRRCTCNPKGLWFA